MSAPDKPIRPELNDAPDFLSRWSRRKVEAREQEPVEAEEQADLELNDEGDIEYSEEQLAELTDEDILEELGLPDPDTLEAGDDFKGFMKRAVPARIRNRALRKLWLSDPVLANVDMLVDYGEDFTDAATVFPDMKTAYEVGKGIARRFEKIAEDLKDDASSEPEITESESESDVAEQQSLDDSEDDTVEMVEVELDAQAEPESQPLAVSEEYIEEEFEPIPQPRRMKFSV
ncbi:MAG: DUF3306 domain-containing protein [Hyphomicrobiales bacterium]